MAIETVTVTPVDSPPWSMLINPLWWMMSGGSHSSWTAPLTNNGLPYLPNIHNQFIRNLMWWFRNPFGNFVGFILGFEGVQFTATGPAPVLASTWRDVSGNITGWKWALINHWAPYISFWNGHIEFYLGWRPYSGGFGLKLVFHHAN